MIMKVIVFSFLCLFPLTSVEWLSDFDEATEIAKHKNQYVLLNFSGSDWCASCINMKREIFLSDAFMNYASENLVLVRADFPRMKKNRLDESQVKKNEALAERYNPHGKFPFTLLLDSNGRVVSTWDGYTSMEAQIFVDEIKKNATKP
jgi:thioredoxin-related protein